MLIFPDNATSSINSVDFTLVSRKPDKGFATDLSFSTIKFETEAGYERRRLRSRRPKRSYTLEYTNVTGYVKKALENFYIQAAGEFSTFNMDLSYLGDTGYVSVRFDGALSIKNTASSSVLPEDNFYSITIKLMEVY